MLNPRGFLHILLWTIVAAVVLKLAVLDACRVHSRSMQHTLEAGDFLLVSKIAYGARTPATLPFTRITLPRLTLPGLGRPARGDVLYFELPRDAHTAADGPAMFVKRCVGIPGDTVEGRAGTIFVNGREFLFPPTSRTSPDPSVFFPPVVVPKRGQDVSVSPGELPVWEAIIRSEGHRLEESPGGVVTIDGVARPAYRLERDYYFVLGDNLGESLDSRAWGFVPEDNILGKVIFTFWSREETASGFWGGLFSIRWDRIGRTVR